MTTGATQTLSFHASCVSWQGRAALILGPSGVGKSSLALQLMALGCLLVSDDQTLLSPKGDALWAAAPDALRGRIEARGLGLLAAETARRARVVLAVDLEQGETDRLPPERWRNLCGLSIPLVHKVEGSHFPAAVLQYIKAGRVA